MVRHPQAASGVVDVLHSSGVDLPQAGHDLQPEEVPGRGAGVGVGGVLYVGDVAGGSVGRQLFPCHVQQWPANAVLLVGHAGKARHAGAPDQVEKNGLRVVIGVVGCVDFDMLPQLLRLLAKKIVPELPGRLLQGEALPLHKAPDIPGAGDEGDVMGGTPVPDEGLIPVGFRAPQPVVEVGSHYPAIPLPTPPVQQVQQAHGVQPAGHGT